MNRLPPARFFPPAESATEDGLVGVGGELSPEWLLDAYGHGIFPWPVGEMRRPDVLVVARSAGDYRTRPAARLAAAARGRSAPGRFEVTCDRDFAGVMRGCASGPGREGGTWITPRMIRAYRRMFALGHAHSVEVWHEGRLAGGVYGLAIGGLFAAESMFHRVRDASKVALVRLVEHLRRRGYRLLDIQQLTPHTARLGAIEIPRRRVSRPTWPTPWPCR